MPELASNITIDKKTGTVSIDGQEFPWFFEDSPSIYGLGKMDMITVNISVLTRNVTVLPLRRDDA